VGDGGGEAAIMPTTTDDGNNLQGAADAEHRAEEERELEETTQFRAADLNGSAKVLREAANLLMAGKSREVARLCHQIIQHEPQNVAAYEMLAMAEEENENLHLALQAYEQILALDPDRESNREKVLALRERLTEEEETGPEDEQSRRLRVFNRWATVALVASLLLLIGIAISVFAVRARDIRLAQGNQEKAFTAYIARGKQLMAAERYQQAIAALQAAEQIKPGDSQVRKLWQEAYQQGRAAWVRNYRSLGGKLSLEPRQNPFGPVRIGPEEENTSTSSAAGSTWSSVVPPPPDTRVADLPPPLLEGQEDPLGFLEDDGTGHGQEGSATPGATGQPLGAEGQGTAEQPAGQISIWTDQPAGGSSSQPSGDVLRNEADSLRHQGRYEQAIAKYQAAQQCYSQEIQQDPSTKAAKQTAIKSIGRSIEICQEKVGR